MEKSVGALASDDKGDQDLKEIEGSSTSGADIWLGITSFGIDCGAVAERYGGGTRLLDQDRRLLGIFGQGPWRFKIFNLGSTSVADTDAPDRNPGEDMPCGYVGSR